MLVLVYVDDMLIAGDDKTKVEGVKNFLSTKFHMKDLGSLRYFLGIEVDRSDKGFFLSQKKYTIDLVKEYGVMGARKLKLPLDTHHKLTADQGDPLEDVEGYQKLIGKLILFDYH